MIRFVFLLGAMAVAASAAIPADLAVALESFRPDPPRGWSYTQTTAAEGRTTVERYDATLPEFARWSLVQKDGRPPTAEEVRNYAERRSRRSRAGSAPKITEQFDPGTVEVVGEDAERATYRSRLRRGEATDRTAPFLRATTVVHKPTRTIESIELASTGAFSPAIGVKIAEMKTRMTYQPPQGDTPMLPRQVTTRVRGTAFWFKSLDADMTVTYSDYERAVRR